MSATAPPPPGLAGPIPLYVTPYRNSKGPAMDTRPPSEALQTATPDTIGLLVKAWRPALAFQPAVPTNSSERLVG